MPAVCDDAMTLPDCAPALSLVEGGVAAAIASADATGAGAGAGGVAAPPEADDVTFWVTAGIEEATVWDVAVAGTTGADEVALVTEVAEGPSVGKFGSPKACEAVPPWPADGSPTLRPRLDATGAPSSMTTTSAATATAPLMALIAAVSLRRRRARLGLTSPRPPLGPRCRGHTVGTSPPCSASPPLPAGRNPSSPGDRTV